ncbi:site-2 protease family protein [Synechocystis sp. PCC 7509]|uniref:site-2 protease family protein n=1 Tax=Synechocystis sp. PCC 7509 TaxID=927677 RepID=UPI0002AC6F1F|nr:site-2 protease family protein [Synechocystis sp. PCC 7509]
MIIDWIILLLMALFTYLIVRRSVTGVTTTPVWLLWLVLMMPPFVWSLWILVYSAKQLPPIELLIGMSILSIFFYLKLHQKGRKNLTPTQKEPSPAVESLPVKEVASPPLPLRPIDKTEETKLKNCFPWSIFYVNNIEYRPQAIICRGQLREKSPSQAYDRIKENVRLEFGDRFLVLFQEDMTGKPFFALVPNTQAAANKRKNDKLTRPGLALGLLIATIYTTTLVGVGIANTNNIEALRSNPEILLSGLPYGISLMTILGIHELGHYLTARYYKIRATLPYFIPFPLFLGTFGAFIQMRSPVPNRKALFDVSIAGPLAGFVVTLPLLIWGLAHSTVVSLPEKAEQVLNPNALDPNYSLLLALLSKLTLGIQLSADSGIDLHPVAVAGLLGAIATALNLIPVGQLDGGHIIHAMFGQRNGIAIGQISRFLILGLALLQPGFWIWAIILFFMPVADEPALNDISELDNKRDILGILAMALLVIIILPMPEQLAQLLN